MRPQIGEGLSLTEDSCPDALILSDRVSPYKARWIDAWLISRAIGAGTIVPVRYTFLALETFYRILLGVAMLVALVFALLVFVTGKGDAMSGGGSVRTTFKGKASIDDLISRMTLILGITFMALMLALDVIGNRIFK